MNENTMKFLVPSKGLIVRDPVTKQPLDTKGEIKPWVGVEGRYWRRRVKCGDANVGTLPKKKK